MTARSAYYAMVIVDIEQFGQRKNPDQQWLRRQMYDVLREPLHKPGSSGPIATEPTEGTESSS